MIHMTRRLTLKAHLDFAIRHTIAAFYPRGGAGRKCEPAAVVSEREELPRRPQNAASSPASGLALSPDGHVAQISRAGDVIDMICRVGCLAPDRAAKRAAR